jgi:IS1 family transposase
LCGKSWTAFTQAFDGMRIGLDVATKIIELLCEGMSVSATARVTNTDEQTVTDLMVLVGTRCDQFMQREIKDVHVEDIQCDEIWQFVLCKRSTAKAKKYVGGCGDCYCYTAVERSTKLLVAWHMGKRTDKSTNLFAYKLAAATTGRFHLSTDGYPAYPMAIWEHLGARVDYGALVKIFREPEQKERRRYSPSKIIGAKRARVLGVPEKKRICTSHAERLNGSIRNFCKRMGRLTYAFSKKWDNHRAALGLFFAHYNWCRKHKSLKGITPAMAHGITNHVWTVRELLEKVTQVAHN